MLLAAIALVGCSPVGDGVAPADTAPACTLAFLGDKSKPIDLQVVARGADGTSKVIDDGSDVAIIFPPQGGRVIFVGPRATNVDPCYVKLTGALRDPATSQVRVEVRTVNLVPTADGWGTSNDADISSFANVATCPNQWSNTDVYDHVFQLEITIEDRAHRKATKTLQVTPRCAEVDRETECRCICKAGYVLGSPCAPSDGGVDASDASDASNADDGGG